MIKGLSLYFQPLKSPVILMGLFCWLSLISGCFKETDPQDTTIMFWMALSENNWDKANKYSVAGSEVLFDKKRGHISLQIGKVEINYDVATVETILTQKTAASRSLFKTYLVRVPKTDQWKVDYAKTLDNISDKEFKNIVTILKKLGKSVTKIVKNKSKSTLTTVNNWLQKKLD